MQRKNGPGLLREHEAVTFESTLLFLESKLVMGDAGKEIYLISNGTRRAIPDFETFVKMKFQTNQVKHLKDTMLLKIPLGDSLPSLME